MKEVKNFIIVDIIIFILKVVGGILCSSFTMIASSVYNLLLVLNSFILVANENNKKYKSIISSLYGLFLILVSIGVIFVSSIVEIKITSLFVIFFVIIELLIKYMISCFCANKTYQRKKGLLGFGNINSNVDFVSYAIIIVIMIIMKISKWISCLKYADILGCIIISGIVIYRVFVFIKRSFDYNENVSHVISDEYLLEIKNRDEVKTVEKVDVVSFGGLNKIVCNVQLRDGLGMMDLNTFVITLQDYLLKIGEMVIIRLVENKHKVKKKVKVRSLKQDARNSGSRNGKTNTKKQNIKKKNKKR